MANYYNKKLTKGIYDPATGRTLDEGTYNPSIGRNLTLYESTIPETGEAANPQQQGVSSSATVAPTGSGKIDKIMGGMATGGSGKKTAQSTTRSYAGDSGRPTYTPKYQDYIDGILSGVGSYGPYTSPYADQIAGALAGIQGYGPYVSPYQDRLDAALAGIEGYGPYSSPFADQITAQMAAIQNRDPFSYDLETDPAWQAYRKQYTREGRRASEDTMGQFAAMTGGMPSTAAMTAASQAADYYNAQMTDKIPELYRLAYDMYNTEGNNMYNTLNALRGLESDDYGRYNDVYNRMLSGYNALQNADATEYGRYGDTYNRMLTELDALQGLDASEYGRFVDQYNRNLQNLDAYRMMENDNYGRFRDTVGDWENDRAWDYQTEQDAWEQAYKQRAYEDSRADTAWEQEYKQKAYDDSRADTEWERAYAMGEVGPTIYAYSDGGGAPYEIGSGKGRSFVESAQPGQTMTGGDGSVWTKNADGSVTITKNGGTWTVAAPATSGGGGYRGTPAPDETEEEEESAYASPYGSTYVSVPEPARGSVSFDSSRMMTRSEWERRKASYNVYGTGGAEVTNYDTYEDYEKDYKEWLRHNS